MNHFYRPGMPNRIRLLASATLCGLLAFASSCQKDQLTPQPQAYAHADDATTLIRDVQKAKQDFAAAGYEVNLVEKGSKAFEDWQWEPQWKQAFKASGLYVPLMFKTSTHGLQHLVGAKRFLVVSASSMKIVTYVYKTAQAAELAQSSAEGLQDFTGQIAQLDLATKLLHVATYTKGLRPLAQAASSKGAQRTQDNCTTTVECRWDIQCADHSVYSTVTYGENTSSCSEPHSEPCSDGPRTWYLVSTHSTQDCTEDPQPQEQVLPDGWYKITALHSGLVMDVYGNTTASGTQVCQFWDVGAPSQKFYLQFHGFSSWGMSVYSVQPGNCYLAGLNMVLGILGPNGGSTANGARATIDYNLNLNSQRWGLSANSNNEFVMMNQYSSKVLEIDGGDTSVSPAQLFQQWTWEFPTPRSERVLFTPTTL
jgi:hypothetical protein